MLNEKCPLELSSGHFFGFLNFMMRSITFYFNCDLTVKLRATVKPK